MSIKKNQKQKLSKNFMTEKKIKKIKMSVEKVPSVQHNVAYFVADAALFFFIWIWPAIKTIAAFQRKDNKGRLGYYWIGASVITSLYYVVRPLLVYWLPGAYLTTLFVFISSLKNGLIIRTIATGPIIALFLKYYKDLKKIPKFVDDLFDKTIDIVKDSIARKLFGRKDKKNEEDKPTKTVDEK